MKLKFGEYQVTTDPLNYKLEQRVPRTDEHGQPLQDQYILRFVGYYPTFERLCDALLDHDLRVSDTENLAEMMEVILKVKREITSVTSEIKLRAYKDVEINC